MSQKYPVENSFSAIEWKEAHPLEKMALGLNA